MVDTGQTPPGKPSGGLRCSPWIGIAVHFQRNLQANFVYRKNRLHLSWNGHLIHPEDVTDVIYRRPKPIQIRADISDPVTRDHLALEWSEAIEGFLAHIDASRWINHPARNYMASHKVEQLTKAKLHGLNVPDTLVTNDPVEARSFVCQLECGAIVKPLASGYIERQTENLDTIIYTSPFESADSDLLQDLDGSPVIFQERLQKSVDVRLTVLDNRMIAVGLHSPTGEGRQVLDIRRDNMKGVEYSLMKVPPAVVDGVRGLLSWYGLRFAALDFAITHDGHWFFLEINPNGQWAWLDSCSNASIGSAFVESLRPKNG